MRAFVFSLALALAAFAPAAAQTQPAQQTYRGPDIAAQRTAMARLAPLIGAWEGQADITQPRAMVVHQTELVQPDHDGLVLRVNGAGFATADHSGEPVFRALGIISYDDMRQLYEFRTYAYGHAATATAVFLPDGSFQWSLPPRGPIQTRFTIRFDATSWNEIGEMSRDGGATWTRTIELNLRKTE
jgi:hypothetical protein